MVEKWDITIPELTGSQTRRAYLYLPDYYVGNINQSLQKEDLEILYSD